MDALALTVRRALPDEAVEISELAIRSKSHWGYTDEEMAVFTAELTVTPEAVCATETYVIGEPSIAGFYSLERTQGGALGLGHMFVRPDCLRAGYGRTLLAHALERVAALGFDKLEALGFDKLEIISDPHAEGFYMAMGARRVGNIESSIAGRNLAVLELSARLD
jgi:GNAT superfamily N-acetyltransferase